MEVEGQQIEMPTPDEKLKFKHQVKVSFSYICGF